MWADVYPTQSREKRSFGAKRRTRSQPGVNAGRTLIDVASGVSGPTKKLFGVIHRTSSDLPLLKTARMSGSPRTWPAEKLERLLTPQEIELIRRGRI
jgi:hypothetical protein